MATSQKVHKLEASDIKFVPGEDGIVGSGSYGQVRLAYHKVHRWIAVKFLKADRNHRENVEKRLCDEVIPVSEANNQNVVRVFGIIKTPVAMGLVMEYLPGRCLSDVIFDQTVALLPSLWLRFCRDIANGVSGIHNLRTDKRLSHGDLKLDNILVSIHLDCKIGDFGSSELAWHTHVGDDSDRSGRSDFTEIFAAPERLLNRQMKLTTAMDVFSIGMIYYYMLEREYGDFDRNVLLLQNGQRPALQNINRVKALYSSESLNMATINAIVAEMKNCWNANPLDRPKIIDVRDNLQQILDRFTEDHLLDCVKSTLQAHRIAKPKIGQWISLHDLDLFDERNAIDNHTRSRTSSGGLSYVSPDVSQSANVQDHTPPKIVVGGSRSDGMFVGTSHIDDRTVPKGHHQNRIDDRTVLKGHFGVARLDRNDEPHNSFVLKFNMGDETPPKFVDSFDREASIFMGQDDIEDITVPKGHVLVEDLDRSIETTNDNFGDIEEANSPEDEKLIVLMAMKLPCSTNTTLYKERKVWGAITKFIKLTTDSVQNRKHAKTEIKKCLNDILLHLQSLQEFNSSIKAMIEAKLLCFYADCHLSWKNFQMAIEKATEAISVVDALGSTSNTISLVPCCYHIIAKAFEKQGLCAEAKQTACNARSLLLKCKDFSHKHACLCQLQELATTL